MALVQWTQASVLHGTRGNAHGCRVKNGAVAVQTALHSDQLRPPSRSLSSPPSLIETLNGEPRPSSAFL